MSPWRRCQELRATKASRSSSLLGPRSSAVATPSANPAASPDLGIAGGSCYELEDGQWVRQKVAGTHPRGASRAYRWPCLEGALSLEPKMGWDGLDEMQAELLGYRTAIFTDLAFRHREHAEPPRGEPCHLRFDLAVEVGGQRSGLVVARDLRAPLQNGFRSTLHVEEPVVPGRVRAAGHRRGEP